MNLIVRSTDQAEAVQSENASQIASALQNLPSNQQVAVDQLRPMADAGDPVAAAFLAYVLGPQTGRWAEGVPYVRTAVDAGVTYPALIYGQNLMGQPDAALRGDAAEFLRVAVDDGWPADPFSAVMQAAQQGDSVATQRLLDVATARRPHGARQQWEELIAEVSARQREVDEVAGIVRAERDRVVADIATDREAVSEQRRSVEQLAAQVGVLANKTAGGAIAEDYAIRAGKVEETARRYTWASIALAVLIAVGAVVGTLVIDDGKLIDGAASKAAIAIPLVALNLYLGRLAAQYRQEAVELRHIELQFNTANPFLSALDEERRKDVLVQLAQKFFPGQALPGSAGGGAAQPDLTQLMAAALTERLSSGAQGRSAAGESPPERTT